MNYCLQFKGYSEKPVLGLRILNADQILELHRNSLLNGPSSSRGFVTGLRFWRPTAMPFLCYSEEIVPFRHLEKSPDLLIATGSELSQGFKTKGFSRASEISGTNKKELQSFKRRSLFLHVLLSRFLGNYSAVCLIRATARSVKAMLAANG
jgi:hypothetical protein